MLSSLKFDMIELLNIIITKELAMTEYNISVGKDLLPELLSNQNGLAKLIESVLNQIL